MGWSCFDSFLFEFYFHSHFQMPGSRTARQIQSKRKMPHASFPLAPLEKNERLLIFLALSGECEPPKNVGRTFHEETITNTSSVGCVCGRGQQVNFTEGSPLMQGPHVWLDSFLRSPLPALHNKPPYSRHERKQTNQSRRGAFSPRQHLHEGPACR